MKRVIVFIIALISLHSFAQQNNFKLTGDFSNLKKADSIHLCNIKGKDLIPFSSAKIDNGTFTLSGYIPYEDEYYAKVTTAGETPQFGKLFVEKRELKYSGTFTRYPKFEVEGSLYAHKVYAAHKDPKYLELRKKVMTLESGNPTDEQKITIQKLQQELFPIIGNVEYTWYPETHPKHQIHLADQYYYDKEFDKFEKQALKVTETYPDHPGAQRIGYVLQFYKDRKAKEAAGIVKKSRVGTQYTDVVAQDVDGKEYKMSQILKENKLVLLDFWASWCGPCRAEFPHLRLAYKEFKDKGFEIFAVSLDESKEKWIKALNEEKTTWINAAGLMAFKSKAVADYGIRGIPYNILVNSKGEILGESLRGEALEKMLEKYLH